MRDGYEPKPNAWQQGDDISPSALHDVSLDPRETLSGAGLVAREKTEEIVALLDAKADIDFAGKVWSVGTIFRDSDEQERKALLAFVNDHWGAR
jgi:hypothetical protein